MKQSIIYALALLSFTMVSSFSHAQKAINPKSDTIKWEYGRAESKVRSESLTISGQLISYGKEKLVWIQNGTDRKYSFEIKSVKGDWSNSSEIGELVYQAICNGINGTVRIYRDRKDVGIHIDFSMPDKLTPNIVLQVNSHSKI